MAVNNDEGVQFKGNDQLTVRANVIKKREQQSKK